MGRYKIVLITGGSRGIGKAIANELYKKGFYITIAARKKNEIDKSVQNINNHNGKAFGVVTDVSKKADVLNAVKQTVKKFGRLDVMINNAGVFMHGSICDLDPCKMKWLMNINVMGTLYGMQAAANQFIKQGTPGKIINACSVAGQVGLKDVDAYSASKFAIRGLTQAAAKDLARDNITVNAYCPGIVKTTMMKDDVVRISKHFHKPEEWGWKLFAKGIALGHVSSPQNVANLVSFLASPKSNYITGQSINVDGGMVFR